MNGGLINRLRNSKVINHYWALIIIEGFMISYSSPLFKAAALHSLLMLKSIDDQSIAIAKMVSKDQYDFRQMNIVVSEHIDLTIRTQLMDGFSNYYDF